MSSTDEYIKKAKYALERVEPLNPVLDTQSNTELYLRSVACSLVSIAESLDEIRATQNMGPLR